MSKPSDNYSPRATRADVARLAGVSTAVVSYVFNNGPQRVAPDTRKRVLQAIQDLDYRPNPSARALKMGSTGVIGVVVPEILNTYFAEFVDAVDLAASAQGNSILLGVTHEDAAREGEIITTLISKGVDGIVFNCRLTDPDNYLIGDPRIPRILLEHATPTSNLPSVAPDLESGTRLAVQHLITHGYKRIAYIGGPLPAHWTDYRSDTWISVLNEHNLPTSSPVITSWDRDGGYVGAMELLSQSQLPDAVFAASDLIGVGALRAIHESGLRIPEDIAIVSLDGTAESAYSWPPLTTVRQPFEKMAESAITVLQSNSNLEKPRDTLCQMTLVVRESCGHHVDGTE